MKDFILNLYQNDNFIIYLSITLVVLIILFVIVLMFGKKDQKLEETKRLQKIEADAFKEEVKEPVKVEVEKEAIREPENVNVTIFEPVKKEESVSNEIKEEVINIPMFDLKQEEAPISLNEVTKSSEEANLEKNLNELESIKNSFAEIKIEDNKLEEFKPSSVFSSVFVNKEEPLMSEAPIEEFEEKEIKQELMDNTMKLFTIEEEDDFVLPTLKQAEEKKPNEANLSENEKPFSFEDLNGETYKIK